MSSFCRRDPWFRSWHSANSATSVGVRGTIPSVVVALPIEYDVFRTAGFEFTELAVCNRLFHSRNALNHSSESAFVSVRGTDKMDACLNARIPDETYSTGYVLFKGAACEVANERKSWNR